MSLQGGRFVGSQFNQWKILSDNGLEEYTAGAPVLLLLLRLMTWTTDGRLVGSGWASMKHLAATTKETNEIYRTNTTRSQQSSMVTGEVEEAGEVNRAAITLFVFYASTDSIRE